MVMLPSVLAVEGQTTSHCKVRHEDQAMAQANDEDIFVGSFQCSPSQNRADLPMTRGICPSSTKKARVMTMTTTLH